VEGGPKFRLAREPRVARIFAPHCILHLGNQFGLPRHVLCNTDHVKFCVLPMRHLDRSVECPEGLIRSVIRDQNLVEHQVSLVKQRQGQNENQQYSNHRVVRIEISGLQSAHGR
jgi:hypothetical protein